MQWNSKNIEGHKKLYHFWDFLKFTPRLHVDLFFVQSFSFLGSLKNLGFVGYVLLFLHSRYVDWRPVSSCRRNKYSRVVGYSEGEGLLVCGKGPSIWGVQWTKVWCSMKRALGAKLMGYDERDESHDLPSDFSCSWVHERAANTIRWSFDDDRRTNTELAKICWLAIG